MKYIEVKINYINFQRNVGEIEDMKIHLVPVYINCSYIHKETADYVWKTNRKTARNISHCEWPK